MNDRKRKRIEKSLEESNKRPHVKSFIGDNDITILQNAEVDKVHCEICREGSNESAFLLCDGPGKLHGGHYYCYGLPFIPKGQWYCKLHKSQDITCMVCKLHSRTEEMVFCHHDDPKVNPHGVHIMCLNRNQNHTSPWYCDEHTKTRLSHTKNTSDIRRKIDLMREQKISKEKRTSIPSKVAVEPNKSSNSNTLPAQHSTSTKPEKSANAIPVIDAANAIPVIDAAKTIIDETQPFETPPRNSKASENDAVFPELFDEPWASIASQPFDFEDLQRLESYFYMERIKIKHSQVNRRYKLWCKALEDRIAIFRKRDRYEFLTALRWMEIIDNPVWDFGHPEGQKHIRFPWPLVSDVPVPPDRLPTWASFLGGHSSHELQNMPEIGFAWEDDPH